ncbi:MAG: translation elongation factor Ts [Thermomicrobiales bacterium]
MVISAEQVKTLREQTGAGIMDCKRALQEADGDMGKASNVLRQQGLAKAEKKSGRAAQQGLVEPYIHAGGRIGVIVEINCETDFVARTPDFRVLAHEVALQIAATNPRVVQESDLDEATLATLDAEYGGRAKALEAVALLNQPHIKDPKLAISDLVRDAIAKLGENIIIRRFSRFEVGADQPAADDESR